MEDVTQSKAGKLCVQENCDITDAKKGADQKSTGTENPPPTDEAAPPVPAPAKNMAETPCCNPVNPSDYDVDQETLDWVKEQRAKLAQIRADPLYQAAEMERKADLTKYLTLTAVRETIDRTNGVRSMDISPALIEEGGKPKIAEDVDWIETELAKLCMFERGELDMMNAYQIPACWGVVEKTYEVCHGSPIDFWKPLWYWENPEEMFGLMRPNAGFIPSTTDPVLRSNRKYYDLFKETVENPENTVLANDPQKQREYRDILRLVIESSDDKRDHIFKRLLCYAKEYCKSGPGEEPIALVAVRQVEKDKNNVGEYIYSPKESSRRIVRELQSLGIDFDETNGKGESANSVVLSMAKDGVMVEGHHSMAEGTGDMMAAMYDPTYNYRNHYTHYTH